MENLVLYKGKNYFTDNVQIYVNIATVSNTKVIVPHAHDFIEIAYVYSGKGFHKMGNDIQEVSKGDLFIINHDFPHFFIPGNDKNEDMLIYNCVFLPEFIDYTLLNTNDFKDVSTSILFESFLIEDRPVISLHLCDEKRNEIEGLYRKMQVEFFTTPKGYINVLRLHLVELLTKIFRFLDTSEPKSEKISSHKIDIINKALDFLKSNYSSSELNMNELAIKTFLSRSYLSKLFIQCTGHSLSQYLQNLRITEACTLLKSTNKQISEIISDVGFKDTKHFNSLFKKIMGTTPSKYRKQD